MFDVRNIVDYRMAMKLMLCVLISALSFVKPASIAAQYSSYEVLSTSEAGAKLQRLDNIYFGTDEPAGVVITVWPDSLKQEIDGIGSSFTESSAFVLAHLDREQRLQVMRSLFSEEGANFSLCRTHIGSCDFTVDGKYSYADSIGDMSLDNFNVDVDFSGFDNYVYPLIRDPEYDLLPMILEAKAIKSQQSDQTLRLISSAWTAPPWMKDIQTWYIPGSTINNWQGTGGILKPDYYSLYADYLMKYIQAYDNLGVDIWGITPVNEPYGVNGQWESMHFTPESQNIFIKQHLGPRLRELSPDVKLLIYDQNRDGLEQWADVVYSDPETKPYLYGAAVHWYESTEKVYEDVFDRLHDSHPDMSIIHTEGCIDDLGKEAPGGVDDPIGYKEHDWYYNDAFWWNRNATDWAYSTTWEGVNASDHPKYVPVHRYARNIIVSLDHWMSGWIDWNAVLDRNGGPNHVGNYCGAPIMIDIQHQQVYYTPIYYILAQFSKTIRPGDHVVKTLLDKKGMDSDAMHTCATISPEGHLNIQVLNTRTQSIDYCIKINDYVAYTSISANSLQTIRIKLEDN